MPHFFLAAAIGKKVQVSENHDLQVQEKFLPTNHLEPHYTTLTTTPPQQQTTMDFALGLHCVLCLALS